MKAPSTIPEKSPFLLHENSKHALEQISSIIYVKDYEVLGNYSMEAMGESGLFAIAQVIRPIAFPSVNLIWCLPNCLFALAFLGNGDGERADGTVSEARGDLEACIVQGRADGGWAEPTTKLENKNGEKVWTFREGEEGAGVKHRGGEEDP